MPVQNNKTKDGLKDRLWMTTDASLNKDNVIRTTPSERFH